MVVVFIDMEKCDGCGACVDVCPVYVFEVIENKVVVVNPDECYACMVCEMMCPNNAIMVKLPIAYSSSNWFDWFFTSRTRAEKR